MNRNKAQVCYASLAIYAKRNMEEEITQVLNTSPSFAGEKNGNFSWIWSTKGSPNCGNIEQHLQLLKFCFDGASMELTRLANEGCEVRIWVYFGLDEVNGSFVLQPDLLAWLALFGADICVDVWS